MHALLHIDFFIILSLQFILVVWWVFGCLLVQTVLIMNPGHLIVRSFPYESAPLTTHPFTIPAVWGSSITSWGICVLVWFVMQCGVLSTIFAVQFGFGNCSFTCYGVVAMSKPAHSKLACAGVILD